MAKKEEKKTDYNYETDLESMKIPEYLKKGFKYYIEENNLSFNNEKDLEKEYKKFMLNKA